MKKTFYLLSKNLNLSNYTLISAFVLFVSFIASTNVSADEHYKRVWKITGELRCLTCEGQSIRESESKFADDVRSFILDLIKQGKSDNEIRHALFERYSAEIFFEPPFHEKTYFLWLSPFLLLLSLLLYACWRRMILSRRNQINK